MNLEYAVDRLFETGWSPWSEAEFETLPDGRGYPSVESVKREFARAGLALTIKQNDLFNCCRATWAPLGEKHDGQEDERHGTVVGTCDREAAVYALAQLRSMQALV